MGNRLYGEISSGWANLLVDDRPTNLEEFKQHGGFTIRYQANESKLDKFEQETKRFILITSRKWSYKMARQILNKTISFLTEGKQHAMESVEQSLKIMDMFSAYTKVEGVVPRLRGMFATLQDADNIRSRD